jgi:hypothetical protein
LWLKQVSTTLTYSVKYSYIGRELYIELNSYNEQLHNLCFSPNIIEIFI